MRNEEFELQCINLISLAGDAKSCFIEAIQSAGEGNFAEAEGLMEKGRISYAGAHDIHVEMLRCEACGEKKYEGLLIMHTEDQLMAAENYETIAEQFMDLHHKLFKLTENIKGE
jgi:PTS system cellobiose-specific IIA component